MESSNDSHQGGEGPFGELMETRLHKLCDEAHAMAIQGYLQDGSVVYWNRASEVMYGYTAAEAIGKNLLDLIIPAAMRQEVEQAIGGMFASGEGLPASRLTLQHKDGHAVPVYSTHAVVEVPGQPTVLFCMDADMSELVRTEGALRESEKRYRAVVEDQTEIIIRALPDGTLRFVNEVFCRFLDKPEEELLGHNWHPFVLPDDIPGLERELARLSPETPLVTTEGRMHSGTGELCWMECVHRGFFDAAGQLLETQSVGRCVCEHKRLVEVLRLAQARFQHLTDANLIGIVIADAEGAIVEANDYYLEILGRSRDDMRAGKVRWVDMTPPEWRPADLKNIAELKARGVSCPYEKEYLRADGTRRSVYLTNAMLPGGTDQILAVVLDITERKRETELLREAEAEAQKANDAKSRFLAAASHDLRQPLMALSLYSEVLQKRLGPDGLSLATDIKNCVEGLSELLTDLLDLSKLQVSGIEPHPSDFDIRALIGKVVSTHMPEARRKGLVLRSRPCRGTMMAHTDPVLFGRILGNLVANAVRFTRHGGVLIALRRHRHKTWIEVWDTGIGIPADKQEAIFEEFGQLDQGERSQEKGSGLGLSIVARTAELLGLEIRLHSRPMHGSLFAIELPLGRDTHLAPRAQPGGIRPLRIGLVDDNPVVVRALTWSLEKLGHQVVTGKSSEELLAGLGQRQPDIVIAELRLRGGESGFEVIKTLRRSFQEDLAAIILTGDADPELRQGMLAGDILVHHKPVDIDTLQGAISTLTAHLPA